MAVETVTTTESALVKVRDDESLPRVLLIGDSISIGYHLDVRSALAGVANVHRPTENGGPTSNGVEKLEEWLAEHGERPWDVIHYNFGRTRPLHPCPAGGGQAARAAAQSQSLLWLPPT